MVSMVYESSTLPHDTEYIVTTVSLEDKTQSSNSGITLILIVSAIVFALLVLTLTCVILYRKYTHVQHDINTNTDYIEMSEYYSHDDMSSV
jgi:flagellar basal body-associated protein FliL